MATWKIEKTGDRLQVIDELINSPIPKHLIEDTVEVQHHYSAALDDTILNLQMSDADVASVFVDHTYAGKLDVHHDDGDATVSITIPLPPAPPASPAPPAPPSTPA